MIHWPLLRNIVFLIEAWKNPATVWWTCGVSLVGSIYTTIESNDLDGHEKYILFRSDPMIDRLLCLALFDGHFLRRLWGLNDTVVAQDVRGFES